jgi:hypothetical protein
VGAGSAGVSVGGAGVAVCPSSRTGEEVAGASAVGVGAAAVGVDVDVGATGGSPVPAAGGGVAGGCVSVTAGAVAVGGTGVAVAGPDVAVAGPGVAVGMRMPPLCVGMGVGVGPDTAVTTLTCPEDKAVGSLTPLGCATSALVMVNGDVRPLISPRTRMTINVPEPLLAGLGLSWVMAKRITPA